MLLFILSFLFANLSHAEVEFEIPMIQKSGSAAEILQDDLILLSKDVKSRPNSRGGPSRGLENELPFSVTDGGQPGSRALLGGIRGCDFGG